LKDTIQQRIGAYCKFYRVSVLEKTRREIANGQVTNQAIKHFEDGNSSNMLHLFRYILASDNRMDRVGFANDLVHIITDFEREFNHG